MDGIMFRKVEPYWTPHSNGTIILQVPEIPMLYYFNLSSSELGYLTNYIPTMSYILPW